MTSNQDYSQFILEQRKKREDLINNIRQERSQEHADIDYYPILPEWRIPGTITKRKPKEGVKDYSISFTRVGIIKFNFKGHFGRASIYQREETEELYVYLKDLTSGTSTYGLGRFTPIITEGDQHFLDFNLASTPVCGYVEGSACPWAKENVTFSIKAGEKGPKYEDEENSPE